MTLILALQYRNGIVLASDSQSTMQATQPLKLDTEKLHVLGGRIAWGGSGSAWLSARVGQRIEGDPQAIKEMIAGKETRLFRHINELQRDAVASFVPSVPPNNAQPEVFTGLFAGFTNDGRPFIFEVDSNSQRGYAKHPFAAIGSGTIFAHHALASIAHFKVAEMTSEQAKALAYRTVENAICAAAYGIGGKVQICEVAADRAWCLGDQEITAVQDTVAIWKEKEIETLGALGLTVTPTASGEIPAE